MKRIRIIAAVLLAALIIFGVAILALPNILLPMVICPGGWFCSDYAAAEAFAAERDSVQIGMDIMMAERNLTAVDEHATGPAVNDWTRFPTGTGVVPLGNIYVNMTISKFYYCWDARGVTYPRSEDRDVAKKPGECPEKSPAR